MTDDDIRSARDAAGWLDFTDIPHGTILEDPNRLMVVVDRLFGWALKMGFEGQRIKAYKCAIKAYELKSYYVGKV